MTTFASYDAAARMRDIIAKIVRDETTKVNPGWKYGVVTNINRTALTADVRLIGDDSAIEVKMIASVQPLSSEANIVAPDTRAAVVRVEGTPGDLWITDVVSGYTYGTAVRVTDAGTADVASTDHGLQIGPTAGPNLIADADEIQARNNGVVSAVGVNPKGGDVTLGNATSRVTAGGELTLGNATSTADVLGKLRLALTNNASLTSTDHAFQIGPSTGTHLVIDNNEIMVRNSSGGASTLHLNYDGGIIMIGETSQVKRAGTLWYSVTFTNSWVNYGGGYSAVQYRKLPSGLVTLRGLMKSGTVGSSAFTLPTGYRPGDKQIFGVVSNGAIGRVDVDIDGTVTAVSPSSSTWVTVSGITFMPTGE